MGDIDYLDPIVADPYATPQQRLESIAKAIYVLMPSSVVNCRAGDEASTVCDLPS